MERWNEVFTHSWKGKGTKLRLTTFAWGASMAGAATSMVGDNGGSILAFLLAAFLCHILTWKMLKDIYVLAEAEEIIRRENNLGGISGEIAKWVGKRAVRFAKVTAVLGTFLGAFVSFPVLSPQEARRMGDLLDRIAASMAMTLIAVWIPFVCIVLGKMIMKHSAKKKRYQVGKLAEELKMQASTDTTDAVFCKTGNAGSIMVMRGMGIALTMFFTAGYLMGFKNLMIRQEEEAMQLVQQQVQNIGFEENQQKVSSETDMPETAMQEVTGETGMPETALQEPAVEAMQAEVNVVLGEETVEEQIIYNENDIIIKVIGLEKREIFGGMRTELKLSIQNNKEGSKNKITAKAHDISVNGYMLGYMDAVDVEAWGDEEEAVIYFTEGELEARQIEAISEIEFFMTDTMGKFQTDMLKVETNIAPGDTQAIDDSGDVWIDANGIRVIGKGILEDEGYGVYVKVYVENNTDKRILVSGGDLFKDGQHIAQGLHEEILPGKKVTEYLQFFSYLEDGNVVNFEESDIAAMRDIKLHFTIKEEADELGNTPYETIYESDIVVSSF